MKNSLLLLGELSDHSMTWLTQISQQIEVPSGKVLIQEGQPIQDIFILLEGELSVTVKTPGIAGYQRRVARLTVGDIVGEMSFVDQRPPSATVTADKPSLVLAMPRQAIARRAQEDVEFGRQFYRGLSYCLSNRLRLMNVSLPQAGIEVSGALPPDLENPEIQARLPIAKARLESLIQASQHLSNAGDCR